MKKIFAVFRNQLSMFLSDKGMLVFYLITALLVGLGTPFFSEGLTPCLSFSMLLLGTFLIPILADSFAGEREKKTLESLLSTGANGKTIMLGKFLMIFLFSLVFFTLCTGLILFTGNALGIKPMFIMSHRLGIGFLAITNLIAIIFSGLYQSALSGDTRTAYSKIALFVVPLDILFMCALFTFTVVDIRFFWYVLGLFLLVDMVVILIYVAKIVRLRQFGYFQMVRYKKRFLQQNIRISEPYKKTQAGIVFAHEMRYLMTLKLLLLHFLILCFAPMAICALGYYYFGNLNLNFAVLITELLMPRTPTNLVAYSIGGEKTYKTAESLLSTPLKVIPMFLAKMAVPIVVSTAMLIISSTLTLIGANLISYFTLGSTDYIFTADQFVLLFPASILSCVSMVLITGVFSARMKKPRNGLYVSSILGLLFVIPPLCIVYATQNHLLWALVYCLLLCVANIVCILKLSGKVSRPQLMSWI